MVDSEQVYRDAMESMALYNLRLLADRKMRLPYLDNNTGVAQTNSHLWMKPYQRELGKTPNQICCYPERRWKKKRRPIHPIAADPKLLGKELDMAAAGVADLLPLPIVDGVVALKGLVDGSGTDSLHSVPDEAKLLGVSVDAVTGVPAAAAAVVAPTTTSSKDKWYDDIDDLSEPPDAGEIEDLSDYSDYDDSYKKKKKKTSKATRSTKSKASAAAAAVAYGSVGSHVSTRSEDSDKVFGPSERSMASSSSSLPLPGKAHDGGGGGGGRAHTADGKAAANDYCDFCLGDSSYNKKTRASEGLVSCSDCGRSGHPSCLQFTDNMKISVKKYPWQCIECKSCGVCGTSENDDQLLFCDDCDRGYHMYCLNPPLSSPPEGNWSCHLCIAEFHHGQKPQWMA